MLIQKNKKSGNKGKNRNIDNISLKIAENKTWDSEDIDFLNSLTKEDYLECMRGKPDDLVEKIRGGLLNFRGFLIGVE